MILKNVRVQGVLTDIEIEDGRIVSIEKTERAGEELGGLKAYPGLIDIHSHGCIGFDTMEGKAAEMSRFELSKGVTTWYPTTMTMSREDIIAATEQARDVEDGAHMPGFHMEGPFINKKFKGAQNEAYIQTPSLEFMNACKEIKIVTIAPEVEGAMEFIKNCPAVVSLGHTEADYDTVMAAAAAGAKCLTHTFNVMPGIHHRAPGPIPAGADSGMYAQLICDGLHIHPAAVRFLIKAYGKERVVLISDSMAATGLGDGEYSFGGQNITVKNGAARTEGGNLAGSTTNLFDCVRCAISFGIPEEDAVFMATESPATLMGLNKGRLAAGYDADIILVDDDFNLKGVYKMGKRVK